MIIDFHTHAFPDGLAPKALPKLSGNSGMHPCFDGTVMGLISSMKTNGIDLSVVLSIATNPTQQQKVNDFTASVNASDNLIGFGSVYPTAPDAFDELDRIKLLGLKGIKLHPDYQEFFIDDPIFIPLYKHIAKLGLITVFHMGYDMGVPEPIHASPERLKNILHHFGDTPVVAAHFGGYMQWNEVETHLVGTGCYIDTSFTARRIPFYQAKRIVTNHGADKILFGSDTPWSDPITEKDNILRMDLSDTDTEKILGLNAARFLNL